MTEKTWAGIAILVWDIFKGKVGLPDLVSFLNKFVSPLFNECPFVRNFVFLSSWKKALPNVLLRPPPPPPLQSYTLEWDYCFCLEGMAVWCRIRKQMTLSQSEFSRYDTLKDLSIYSLYIMIPCFNIFVNIYYYYYYFSYRNSSMICGVWLLLIYGTGLHSRQKSKGMVYCYYWLNHWRLYQ